MEAAKRGNPVQEEHEIGRNDMGFEFMLNTLRLTGGFDPNLFGERTGMSINAIDEVAQRGRGQGVALSRSQADQADRTGPAFSERFAGDVFG